VASPIRIARWGLPLLALLAVAAGLFLRRATPAVPQDVDGAFVYVSDRDGVEALYERRLPRGDDRRLTFLSEPVRAPTVSPDSTRVAFAVGGRIGVLSLHSGEVKFLSLGVDWFDGSPSWRPDGRALLVRARRPNAVNGDIHLLLASTEPNAAQADRRPLTLTPGLDESSPVFGPGGSFIVFVREDSLFRMDLSDGATRRITRGFRLMREPHFLPSGRLLAFWSERKSFGLDAMDADGKGRETLSEGSTYYRTFAPSPDGRFLLGTYRYDLGFHPLDALKPRQTEEIHLLDVAGRSIAPVVSSWRHTNHSPSWIR
jgi:Tol biopolymer transport system component